MYVTSYGAKVGLLRRPAVGPRRSRSYYEVAKTICPRGSKCNRWQSNITTRIIPKPMRGCSRVLKFGTKQTVRLPCVIGMGNRGQFPHRALSSKSEKPCDQDRRCGYRGIDLFVYGRIREKYRLAHFLRLISLRE